MDKERSSSAGINTPSRVLIVDDEVRILNSLKIQLEKHGYVVDTAQGGLAACGKLSDETFDLVLLDLVMNDLSGQHVMSFMADNSIDTAIIVISGQTSFTAVSQALRNGASDYLKKPFSIEELLSSAERVLEKKRLERDHLEMHERLYKSDILQRYIMNSSPDIIFMLDRKGRFTFLNNAITKLLGYERQELQNKHFGTVLNRCDRIALRSSISDFLRGGNIKNMEVKIRARNEISPIRHFELTVFPIFQDTYTRPLIPSRPVLQKKRDELSDDSEPFIGIYGSARDITDRKQAEEYIIFHAYHDLLTRLPNRSLLKDRLNMAIAQSRRENHSLAVLFLDLDRFKVVNDTLGHAMGDRLLILVAARLKSCLREGDTLSRFGGDEFALLLPEIRDKESAGDVARKIISEIKKPFMLGPHEIFIGMSIGIAVFPDAGVTMDQLIQNADIAMYHVKTHGKDGFQFFSDRMVAGSSNRLETEREMRRALENGEFQVYYQPQINSVNDEVTAVEALVRWHHPDRGIIFPSQFIPLAEETNLIVAISDWVMKTACEEVKGWIDAGHVNMRLAINFASAQIERPRFVEIILDLLKEHDFPPENLEIELTENIIMRDLDSLIANLQILSDEGVMIAIDDFGTGYSSLSCLNKLPIHTLKVDKSFVQDIQDGNNEACIVNAIVAMARGLKLKIVAEGVETQRQLDYLKNLGCQSFQGYFYAEALPANEVLKLIGKSNEPVTAMLL